MPPSLQSQYRQQFIPLLPEYARPRELSTSSSTSGSASSIWAPQNQSPNGTWPRNTHSYDELAPQHLDNIPQGQVFPANDRPITKEDVFGPPNVAPPPMRREIGAIGDGRQRGFPLDEADHVAQLLRTLDLNSPLIEGQTLSQNKLDFDLSPSTTSSFPNTPLETSPTTSCGPPDVFHSFGEYTSPAVSAPARFMNCAPVHGEKYPTDYAWNNSTLQNVIIPTQQNQTPNPHLDSVLDAQLYAPQASVMHELRRAPSSSWRSPSATPATDWTRSMRPFPGRVGINHQGDLDYSQTSTVTIERFAQTDSGGSSRVSASPPRHQQSTGNEPINFLSLLHPSSSPPYALFVSRIVKSSDQQASIFLQQKLKVADDKERAKIVDAICTRGCEMMSHRFGNWAVQRCLEAASTADERRKIASCLRGNVVELATNCYGCHVLQKALDCEEDIRLLIVSELLLGDPAKTLINKHASHVWSKIMEISWTSPAPPIFAYVNKALHGKWASLACHETGSLVVQHAFENLEEAAKDGIVDELLNRGPEVFADVAKNQWGSYCIQHILEHGSEKHRELALSHILTGLLDLATNEQGFKSVTKALKEGGKDSLDKFVGRMREAPTGGRRAIIVDLALSATGSQLIASILPNSDKEQRTMLYDAIRGHIVTLRGCKTGSKVIWLFDRMRAYYGS